MLDIRCFAGMSLSEPTQQNGLVGAASMSLRSVLIHLWNAA